MLKFPEDNARFRWTRHIKNKMVYYNLSANYLLRIFRTPQRREEGIAKGTIAAMKTKKSSSVTTKGPKETEVWIMYALNAKRGAYNAKRDSTKTLHTTRYTPRAAQVTMISAWRYPGKTKPGAPIPIPNDILQELAREGLIA